MYVCTQIRRDESYCKEVNGQRSGPGCLKLTTSLVNVSLKFKTLISQICQYFLLKKIGKLLQELLSVFQQKNQCFWL